MNYPTTQDEKELLSVDNNALSEVHIPGSKDTVKIGWIKPYTLERASKIILRKKENLDRYDPKLLVKLASLYILNGPKIILFHPIYWRYLYYIKGYRYDQLMPIIEEAKKKVPVEAYIKATILALGMAITPMNLTKEEAESIRAGLL